MSVTVILTLAVALGATIAVFSVLKSVLFRSLPYPEAERLVAVSIVLPPKDGSPGGKAFLDASMLDAWSARTHAFLGLAAYRAQPFTVSGDPAAERVSGLAVSPSLFPVLGISPARGRPFLEEDQRPHANPVVVLSYGFWLRRFGGDPGILGQTVRVDGTPSTVVGVLPQGVGFPDGQPKLWMPLKAKAPAEGPAEVIGAEYFPVVGRLRDGVSLHEAEAEGESILENLEVDGLTPRESRLPGKIQLVPLRDELTAEARPALLSIFLAVVLVLSIACANLANLIFAQSTSRTREMAIRRAVGAGRAQLLGQQLIETTLLGLAGGAVALPLAKLIVRVLPGLVPQQVPGLDAIHLDAGVYLFGLALSVAAGLALGLLPALRHARAVPATPLHAAGLSMEKGRSRHLLAVTEIALAVVLMTSAGLLLRSFHSLTQVDPGFQPTHVLSATLTLGPEAAGPGQAERFFGTLLERLSNVPGVEAAGAASFLPLGAKSFSFLTIGLPGELPARRVAVPQLTSPGYLQALGMRLTQGRWLTEHEHASRSRVAVVNEAFVRAYLAGRDAVGTTIDAGGLPLEIIGVVADVRLFGPASDPKPTFYASYLLGNTLVGADVHRLAVVIRTATDPSAIAPHLRAQVRELAPELPLEDLATMDDRLTAQVARPRFYALLLSVFAAVALLLATGGIYSILSYSVSAQTYAIGVRRALGAQRTNVLSLVFREGFGLVAVGLSLGFVLALGTARLLAGFLFEVPALDPFTYAAVALGLGLLALVACGLPAWRAAKVDPVVALKSL